ncbi:hypothetical protein ACIQI8_27500 [Streptomyces sp. NPDC092369]|uniref:hypothetical protein n=1 Tax=Streptomyces sp. NPDC092369 TaxID=3366015 RepID=UPI0037FFCE9D
MSISHVATASAVTSTPTATSLACNVPAGTADTDVMIMLVSRASGTATVTTPSGWTVIPNFPVTNSNGTALAGFYRVASSEPASYTVAFSTGKAIIAISSYRGVDNTTPIHQSAAAADTTTRAAHTSPSVTTTLANCWIVAGYVDRGSITASTWSTPSGLTSRSGSLVATGTNNNSLATFDTNSDQPTGSYSYSSTASGSTNTATMCTVALAPAPPAAAAPQAIPVCVRQAVMRAALR